VTFRRFGKPRKHLRDPYVTHVKAQRWQCTVCGYVFRVYPQGVTRRQQSLRLQGLSVFFWTLGMSLGAVTDALSAFDCTLSRPGVLANLRRAGIAARREKREYLRSKATVRVLGMDCSHLKLQGRDKTVIQTVDAQTGITLDIMPLPGEDERTIRRYVQTIAKMTDCEVIVTDDADVFKAAADAAAVQQQVCQQHVVPNTLRLLSEIAEQLESLPAESHGPDGVSIADTLSDVAALEEIILGRASGSAQELDELQQRYQKAALPRKGTKASPWCRLRLLTLDLSEDWPRLTLADRYRDRSGQRLVPPTNNISEQQIGLNIKERYRTMRGYKSMTSVRCLPLLTAHLRENQGSACLARLLAA
jgi:hypothetical protein